MPPDMCRAFRLYWGRPELRCFGRIYGCAYSTNGFPQRPGAIPFVHKTGPKCIRESTLNRLGVYIGTRKGNTGTGSRSRQRVGPLSTLVHAPVLLTSVAPIASGPMCSRLL